jgi:hypothetical protein
MSLSSPHVKFVTERMTDCIVNLRVQVRNLRSLKHFRATTADATLAPHMPTSNANTIHRETKDAHMLESTVELVGGLCLSAVTLLIGVCIAGSVVAALLAVDRQTPRGRGEVSSKG